MFNPDQLKGITLKKTNSSNEKKQTEKLELICKDDDTYRQLMEETYLEKYLEEIKHLTFQSSVLQFSKDMALEITKRFSLQLLLKEEELKKSKTNTSSPLISLVENIDNVISEKKWIPFFIRLSSRSPKDAMSENDNSWQELLKKQLQFIENDEKNQQVSEYTGADLNRCLHSLYRASTFAMACKNGMEAVNMLIRSERIQNDLKEYVNSPKAEMLNVVIREFRFFHPELEFRAFIWNRKLTSITQYNEMCFFPCVLKHKSEIEKILRDQLENRIIPNIPHRLSNFALDIVLCPNDEESQLHFINQPLTEKRFLNNTLFVIEVNPLAEFTGFGLFNWDLDHEIIKGKKEFEFRVSKKAPEFAFNNLNDRNKRLLQQLLNEKQQEK